jgi:hypothetical protein
MGKIVMTLRLPDPKVRKKTAKAVQYHKDKSKYCRKAKHKGPGWNPTGLCHSCSRRTGMPHSRAKAISC